MKKSIIAAAFFLFAGVVFGQTLQEGNIIAVRAYEITLQPDVTMNQFLDFWKNKWKPAQERAYPGTKVFLLKGDRGEHANQIGVITYFESKELRDKYWPKEGEPGPFDEAASEIYAPLMEEGSKFVVDSKSVYTDWVIQ